MGGAFLASTLQKQVEEEAQLQESALVAEVQAALTVLDASVARLAKHRACFANVREVCGPDIDYLLVDHALRTCQELMKV